MTGERLTKLEKNASTHVLAANNPLYGAVNFIVLTLPRGWMMRAGYLPPAVDEVEDKGTVKWVAMGSTRGIAFNGERALEIEVSVSRKGDPSRGAEGRTTVNGHDAYYSFGREKSGFIKRKTLDYLRVRFYCDETKRLVEIKVRGVGARSLLEEFLEYMEGSRCH